MEEAKAVPKLKKFVEGEVRRYEQAHIIWGILSGWIAIKKKTITYGELAELMGYSPHAGRTLGAALGIVSIYCLYNKLPPISVIVVGKVTKVPGWQEMIRHGETLESEQKLVFSTPWYTYRTPTVGTLRKANDHLNWKDYI